MRHHQVVGVTDQLQHLGIQYGAVELTVFPCRLLKWQPDVTAACRPRGPPCGPGLAVTFCNWR